MYAVSPAVAVAPDAVRTLLVDDDAEFRALCREILELSGNFVVVAEAANGADAVARVRAHRPDLVLLDVSMPMQDGLEALPRIRRASPRSAVVMLSAEAGCLAPKARRLGAAVYLQKGVEPDALVAALRRVTRG